MTSGGTVVGDGNKFEFYRPIYVWGIVNQSQECYYDHDAKLCSFHSTYGIYPVVPVINVIQQTVTSTYSINPMGIGGQARLNPNEVISFSKYPLRINSFSLFRLTGTAIVHLFYSFSEMDS